MSEGTKDQLGIDHPIIKNTLDKADLTYSGRGINALIAMTMMQNNQIIHILTAIMLELQVLNSNGDEETKVGGTSD